MEIIVVQLDFFVSRASASLRITLPAKSDRQAWPAFPSFTKHVKVFQLSGLYRKKLF